MFARAVAVLIAVLCLADVSAFAQPQSAGPSSVILFENVRIFDGKSSTLSGSMNVLVRGNTIEKISKDPIPIDRSANTRIVDGGGRTLMPGLIDAHWHAMLVRPTPAEALTGDVGYVNLVAGAEATDTLMRGFTTVRDVGGPVVRAQARHRRGRRRRSAHLSVRRHHHRHQRSRRLPPAVRSAARPRRAAVAHGADRRQP